MSQQLATAAARTIRRRVLAHCANPARPRPSEILQIPDATLRSAGLSRQKLEYVRNVAAAFESGPLARYPFSKRSDSEIIETLTKIRGVGRWTAEMFLMFSLRRPDIFSVGDYGLRSALAQVLGTSDVDPREAGEYAERWRPWRTVASLVLWRSIDGD